MTTVQYKNTFPDLLWFALYTYTRSPVMLVLFALFAIFAGFSANQSVPASASPVVHVMVVFAMTAIATSFLLIFVAVFVVLGLISKANRTILTQHAITITESVLIEETEFNRTEMKWAGLTRVARTRRHIFAYTAQYAAHVIPRRAFPDAVAWDIFFENLRSRAQTKPRSA